MPEPKTIDEALALFNGDKICMHRVRSYPETWHVQAYSFGMRHQGNAIEVLVKFRRLCDSLFKLR